MTTTAGKIFTSRITEKIGFITMSGAGSKKWEKELAWLATERPGAAAVLSWITTETATWTLWSRTTRISTFFMHRHRGNIRRAYGRASPFSADRVASRQAKTFSIEIWGRALFET